MTDIGEGVSVEVSKEEKPEKGGLIISVRDICTGERIPEAEIKVGRETKTGDDQGEAEFSDLSFGAVNVKVKKHFKDVDYATFLIHYPRLLKRYDAKSAASDVAEIKKDTTKKIRVEIEVYKLIDKCMFHRKHIDPGGEDKYGHWWTVVDDDTSFGWWPKYHLGREENRNSEPPKPLAELPSNPSKMQIIQHKFEKSVYNVKSAIYNLKESAPGQTARGVEGELNGQTSFGGTATKDPHHSDSGDEQYQPIRFDCFELSEIRDCISSFSKSYSGEWSWFIESGNHCHTFQKKLMKNCKLEKVKVLK